MTSTDMSKKSIFVTFGWTESPIISAILRYGIKEGDHIFLILPERRDERSDAAIRDLKTFVSNYVKDVVISELRIDINNSITAIQKLKKMIERERGGGCIVNLSGGMRILVLLTYIAACLADHPSIVLELETEDKRALVEIPRLKLAELSKLDGLPWPTKEIIRELLTGPMRAPELRKKIGASPSTFHRAQTELLKLNYIEVRREGRACVLYLTRHGRMIAELLS